MRILSVLCFSAVSLGAGAVPEIAADANVATGVLSNGITYYIAKSGVEKGMADIALVQKFSGRIPSADTLTSFVRSNLDSSAHFASGRSLRFFSNNGLYPSREGYVKVGRKGVVYHFGKLDLARGEQVADSTLLMVMDLIDGTLERASLASFPVHGTESQAIIIAGDIDKDAYLKKLKMLSLMINSVSPGSEEGVAPDIPVREGWRVIRGKDSLSALMTLTFRTAGIPSEYRKSAMPVISSYLWRQAQIVMKERISETLSASGVRAGKISFRHFSTSETGGDEICSVYVPVNVSDTAAASAAIASVLGKLRADGVNLQEYVYAKRIVASELRDLSMSPVPASAEYVRLCSSAFIYGTAVFSRKAMSDFFLTASMDDEKGAAILSGLFRQAVPSSFCGGDDPVEVFSAVPDQTDTLLFAKPSVKIKIRKIRKDPASGGQIWVMSNGMTVIYKNMPTAGNVYYSCVLRGGFSSVADLRRDEGAYYSDLLEVGSVCGVDGKRFADLLEFNGIRMRTEVSLSDIRVSGVSPSSGVHLLFKSLISLANNYSADDECSRYMCSQKILLGSRKGEQSSRLSAIDSIMCPGYKYSSNKSLKGLYPDFPQRVERYMAGQFSRANDGAVVIVSDIDENYLKTVIQSYLGGFRTDESVVVRSPLMYQPVSGWSTYISDGDANSIDLVMSSRMNLNGTNYMSAKIVTMALQDHVSKAMSASGKYVRVFESFSSMPQERYNVHISVTDADISGFPASVVRRGFLSDVYAVRSAIYALLEDGISPERLSAYKKALTNAYDSRQTDPEYWLDVAEDRVSKGKNLDASYKETISSVSAESVNAVLRYVEEGGKIEYVIKKDE